MIDRMQEVGRQKGEAEIAYRAAVKRFETYADQLPGSNALGLSKGRSGEIVFERGDLSARDFEGGLTLLLEVHRCRHVWGELEFREMHVRWMETGGDPTTGWRAQSASTEWSIAREAMPEWVDWRRSRELMPEWTVYRRSRAMRARFQGMMECPESIDYTSIMKGIDDAEDAFRAVRKQMPEWNAWIAARDRSELWSDLQSVRRERAKRHTEATNDAEEWIP